MKGVIERWLLVRARDAREYIESIYRERIENLMREIRRKLLEA